MAKATREAFGETLAELVKEDKNIVVLDADLTKSTMSVKAKEVCEERHFNMGIAEGNLMSVAAGFASSGYTVFATTFSMFATGRAWEQVRNSIVYPHLNVKVCGTHAGISVGEDGVSHQAIEDISLMRTIPEMEVYSPCDANETRAIINHVAKTKNPCYVRLGRSKVDDVYDENKKFEVGKIDLITKGSKIAVFATGLMVQEVLKASEILKKYNIDITLVNVSSIKPLDEEGIKKVLETHEIIVTAEEHNIIGGLGSAISDVSVKFCPRKIVKIAIQDRFAESGPFDLLLKKYKLDAESVASVIRSLKDA